MGLSFCVGFATAILIGGATGAWCGTAMRNRKISSTHILLVFVSGVLAGGTALVYAITDGFRLW